MQILADHCIHPDLVEALRAHRIKVIQAKEIGLAKLSDEAVFNFACKNSLVLFTFDHDFGDTSRFAIRNSSGVVIFYIERMTKRVIFERAVDFFGKTKKNKLKGKLFIVEPERIRIWPKIRK